MTAKTKGEWPYHEDPHGDWVACSSNPCKLHSGGDIMATSPEDAFAKADCMAHPQGGDGLTGGDAAKPKDRGIEAIRRLQEDRDNRQARVMEKMQGVYKEPLDDPPDNMKNSYDSSLFVGGKFLETRSLPKGKVATLMRHDIAQLKKAGGIPKGWKVKVKTNHDRNDNDFSLTIIRPAGTAPAYRQIRATDIYDPNGDGESKLDYQVALREDLGVDKYSGDFTYEQAEDYCKRHPEIRLNSDEFDDARKYLQDIAGQYKMDGISSRSWGVTEIRDSMVLHYPIDEEKSKSQA